MRLLRRIASWIDFFVSLVAAVYIFTVVLQMSRGIEGFWARLFTLRLQRWGPAVYTGLFLVLLLLLSAILRAVQHVTSRTGGRYLEFQTPSGTVFVRANSVEDVINRTVRDMDEVADASAVLVVPKAARVPTEVRVRCRLYSRPNLLALQDQVRAVVSQCYLELFPGEEPVPVQVSVEQIVPRRRAPRRALQPDLPSEAGEDDAQPIRPQYPVEEEDTKA